MSLTLNYNTFEQGLKSLFKNRDLDEDQWVEQFCILLQTHLLSAEVSTVLTGTAGSTPITGTGSGDLT